MTRSAGASTILLTTVAMIAFAANSLFAGWRSALN
jgi:hypothetical protein